MKFIIIINKIHLLIFFLNNDKFYFFKFSFSFIITINYTLLSKEANVSKIEIDELFSQKNNDQVINFFRLKKP